MVKINRHDFERLSGHLNLKLVEAAQACIFFHGRNQHSYNRMFLVIRAGGGENFIRNHSCQQLLRMRAGNVYFMPGNTDLEFSFQSDMQFVSFHFHLELFGRFDVFALRRWRVCSESPDRRGMIPELVELLAGGAGLSAQCRLQGAVLTLAADFLAESPPSRERLDLIARKYAEIFDFIRDGALATTTIDELAAVARRPRDRLSREFSRECGVPLKKYLAQSLVRRAESLLLEPHATARAVAEELHFNNEYYFSRFFKKNTGRTPGEYRRQERRNLGGGIGADS